MTLGEVEILVGGFFFRASLSWLGVTKYEEKETFRWPGNLDMFERNSRVGEPTERKALEAMVDNAAGKTQVRRGCGEAHVIKR
jgi:hypothetical protein